VRAVGQVNVQDFDVFVVDVDPIFDRVPAKNVHLYCVRIGTGFLIVTEAFWVAADVIELL